VLCVCSLNWNYFFQEGDHGADEGVGVPLVLCCPGGGDKGHFCQVSIKHPEESNGDNNPLHAGRSHVRTEQNTDSTLLDP